MNGGVDAELDTDEFQIYLEFLTLFHETQPNSTIIIIGDRENFGHEFA